MKEHLCNLVRSKIVILCMLLVTQSIAIFPPPAFANESALATLSADKSSYVKDKPIAITFDNAAGYAGDWIGIFPVDADPSSVSPLLWLRTNGTTNAGTNGLLSGQVSFQSNYLQVGSEYEARLYFNNVDGTIEAKTDPFTILPVGSDKSPTLVSDKTSYIQDTPITIAFDDAAGYAGDWIGIFSIDADPASVSPLLWLRTNGATDAGTNGILSGQVTFQSHYLQVGSDYEARLFFNNVDGVIKAKTAVFNILPVGSDKSPTLVSDKASYVKDSAITINFDDAAGYAGDWIGIFPVDADASSTSPLLWLRTNGSTDAGTHGLISGQVTFQSNYLQVGSQYEARLYFNNVDGVIKAKTDPFSINVTTLNSDKSSYVKDNPITISFDGAAGYAGDWIGIFSVGADPQSTSPLLWLRTNGTTDAGTNGLLSGQVTFQSNSLQVGNDYEARLYFNNVDGVIKAKTTAFSILPVGSDSMPTLVADKTSYVKDTEITIAFDDAAGYAGDWIGIFSVDADPSSVSPLLWLRTNGTTDAGTHGLLSGQVTFHSNYLQVGSEYEARLYFNNVDGVIKAKTESFTILPVGSDKTPTLVSDKTSYVKDNPITITFDDAAGYAGDWIGIFTVDADPASVSPVLWLRTNGSTDAGTNGLLNGQVIFQSNYLQVAGEYEARLYFNNVDGVIKAKTEPFTILPVGSDKTPTLVSDKTNYVEDSVITITFDDAAGYAGDWIGLFSVDADPSSVSPLLWLRTNGTTDAGTSGLITGQVSFQSTYLQVGLQYEARLYFNNVDGVIKAKTEAFSMVGANGNLDTDGDGLSDELELAHGLDPNDPADAAQDADSDGLSNIDELLNHNTDPNSSDSDGDSLPDGEEISIGTNPNNVDSDNDGSHDAVDTYPTDSTQHQLGAVTGLSGSLQSTHVEIVWQAHSDQANLGGFRLERRLGLADQSNILLPNADVNQLNYSDNDIDNGQGYQYRVTALDQRGNLGQPSEWLKLFVSYNTTEITDLTADRTLQASTLQWVGDSVDRYRIYRSVANSGFDAIADVVDSLYTDASSDPALAYAYKVASIRQFTNPFTDESIEHVGPLSDAVNVAPAIVYQLQISLNDATKLSEDNYALTIIGASDLAVSGRYNAAQGDVRITAVKGDTRLTTQSSDGTFYLDLSTDEQANSISESLGSWQITAQDLHPNQSSNAASLTVLLQSDDQPPVLTIKEGLATSTAADSFVLRLTAIDQESTVSDVYATSDRFDDVSFQGEIGANGDSVINVPLLHGVNTFTLYAVDAAGNQSSIDHTVERAVSLVPVLTLTTPNDGSATTAERIEVAGTIYSNQAASELRVLVDAHLLQVSGDGGEQGYHFSLPNYLLSLGSNTITVSVQSAGGNVSQTRVVNRIDPNEPVDETQALAVTLSRPLQGAVSNSQNITFSGTVSGGAGALTLVINGQTVPLVDESFTTSVTLANCDGIANVIPLQLSDAMGNALDETIDISCDDSAPVITVLAPAALQADSSNAVLENPLPVSGTVQDANLAGVSLNGESLVLVPTGDANTYRFEALLQLSDGENQLDLQAWDKSNNDQSISYSLAYSQSVQITVLSPQQGLEVNYSSDPVTLDVLAQVAGVSAGDVVSLMLNDASPLTMTLDGETARLSPTVQLLDGENTLIVQVHNSDGVLLNQTRVLFNAIIDEAVDLAVERSEPAANSEANAPSEPLMVYFNKAVPLDEITLIVTQSAHGPNYDLSNQQAAAYTEIPKPELVQVNVDQQPVEGGLAPFNNDRVLGFYPKDPLHYGATVYVEVLHNGESLRRFSYTVQDLPTMVTGIVTDVFNNPVGSLLVSLPELGLSTVTDSFGNYAFGGGEDHKIPIASGQFKLVLNTGQENPAWGTSDHWINIQQSRVNNIVPIRVPIIASTEPFVSLKGGDVFSLHRGAIELDLSNAKLQFAKGREAGNVQVQMLLLNALSHQPSLAAVPQFAWHLQAGVDGLPGIGVQGDVGVTINIPSYKGAYDHIPLDETRVVILGLDARSLKIMPVGVGKVQGRQIINTTPLEMARLDYISYAVVPYEKYQHLWLYEKGEYRTIAQLRAQLEASQ